MNWHEYVNKTGKLPEWPYEVNYGKENVVESDVLVVGGGVAGCRAAISAAQHGVSVVVADRGFVKHSGQGGAYRPDEQEAEDADNPAEDADGEVVDQHLEACRDLAFDRLVEFLDDPAAQRARQHSAHQHGIIGSAADNADAGDRAQAHEQRTVFRGICLVHRVSS